MIDYCSTEIVAYADTNNVIPCYEEIDGKIALSFNEAYPYWKNGFTRSSQGNYHNSDGEDLNYNIVRSWEVRVTDYYVSKDSDFYSISAGNGRIYALILRSFGDYTFTYDDVLNSIGVCYYVVRNNAVVSDDDFYLRLDSSSIPADIINPFSNSSILDIDGEDVFWLYSFGEYLFGTSSGLGDLFNININGYNLLNVLFGSGFIIYCSWVLFKWVIGIF